MSDATIIALSLVTGVLTGAVFRFFQVPIPAPPNLAGIIGIVGIFVGFRLVGYLGWGFDVLEALGL